MFSSRWTSCAVALAAATLTGQDAPRSVQDASLSRDHARASLERGPNVLLPQAIASFGAARSGNFLYVYGGHIGRTHAHSKANLTGRFHRIRLDRIGLDGGRDSGDGDHSAGGPWEVLPAATPLQSVALVAHAGSVYRIGGMTAHNEPGAPEQLESTADFARYDPDAGMWTDLPPLPQPRSSHDAFVIGSELHVVGGWMLGAGPRQWHDTMAVCDLATTDLRWRQVPVPFRRRALAVTAHAGRLWVLGGLAENGRRSQRVDAYDPETGTWTRGPDLPFRGFAPAAVDVGGQLVAAGWDSPLHRLTEDKGKDKGKDKDKDKDTDEDNDEGKTNDKGNDTDAGKGWAWSRVRDLTASRLFLRMIALDDHRCLVVGGARRSGHLRTLEVLDVRPWIDRTRVTTWEVITPGDARNRQGLVLHEDGLYAFGGNRSRGQHDFESEDFLAQAFRIDLTTMQVEPLADLPAARQSMVVAAADPAGERFWMLGGFGHDGEVARAFNDGLSFAPQTGRCSPLPFHLPEPRTQFGLVRFDDALWVFGGTDFDPRRGRKGQFRFPLEVLRCDAGAVEEAGTTTGFVATGSRLTTPRRAFGCAVVGAKAYLIGGMGPDFSTIDECEVFDFATQTFARCPAPPRPWISPQVAVLDGVIYATAGSTRGTDGKLHVERALHAFDPETGTWSIVLDKLPDITRHSRLLASSSCLWLYSAHHETPHLVTITAVHPAHPSPR